MKAIHSIAINTWVVAAMGHTAGILDCIIDELKELDKLHVLRQDGVGELKSMQMEC